MRSVFTSTLFSVLMLALTPALAAPQHVLTVYGEAPKYAAGFDHFDYTNPNAPKGGSLRRSAMEIGQFDHLVPYLDKGIGVSDIDGLVYSPLAVRSLDEPYTVYGLIAQGIERAPDGLWLRFYLDPRATFADGTPITAEDVRYTFNLFITQGSLRYRSQFADVKAVVVEGERQVRFDLKTSDSRSLPLVEGPRLRQRRRLRAPFG
jgi:microcin C transport system substrate-binding protein